MDEITRAELIALLEELAANVEGEIYYGYSGRFMYGEKCFGIVFPPAQTNSLIEYAIVAGIGRPNFDSMGLDKIAYWTDLDDEKETFWVTPLDEDEYEDEDEG